MDRVFTLMVFVLVLLSVGVGYGLWSNALKTNITVHVLPIRLEIGSWKVFAGYECGECKGYDIIYLSPNNTTLSVIIGDTIIEYIWIRLVVENNRRVELLEDFSLLYPHCL
jgi:hypothetical protein